MSCSSLISIISLTFSVSERCQRPGEPPQMLLELPIRCHFILPVCMGPLSMHWLSLESLAKAKVALQCRLEAADGGVEMRCCRRNRRFFALKSVALSSSAESRSLHSPCLRARSDLQEHRLRRGRTVLCHVSSCTQSLLSTIEHLSAIFSVSINYFN